LPENTDLYSEFLSSASQNNLRYLIFGGFAVNVYGFSRVTEDLDVWIENTNENLSILKKIILGLGFPDEGHLADFISGNTIMLRLADEQLKIDLLTKINIKRSFADAFKDATVTEMPYGKIFFISYDDLIDEKIRAKRPKDLLDVQQLRLIRGEEKN
jgi:hypothetical protein